MPLVLISFCIIKSYSLLPIYLCLPVKYFICGEKISWFKIWIKVNFLFRFSQKWTWVLWENAERSISWSLNSSWVNENRSKVFLISYPVDAHHFFLMVHSLTFIVFWSEMGSVLIIAIVFNVILWKIVCLVYTKMYLKRNILRFLCFWLRRTESLFNIFILPN